MSEETLAVNTDKDQAPALELHPAHGVLDRLEKLAATFGSHAEGKIVKLVNEARALLS